MKRVSGFFAAALLVGLWGGSTTTSAAGPPPAGGKSSGAKAGASSPTSPAGRPVVSPAGGPQMVVLPADFALDGKIGEWKTAPAFTLGASNQVAGSQKPVDAADIGARIWLAQKGMEIILAADVTDDTWRPPGSDADDHERIRSDHLEIWLSFAEPNFPPIAFGNQFGETAVPTTAACKELEQVEACEKWWKEQVSNRRKFEEGFVRQLITDGAQLWEIQGGDLMPVEGQVAARTERTGGYSLEVRFPVGVLPAVRSVYTPSMRLLVDVNDNDQGADRQETFLSSSARRDPKDRSTWNTAKLSEPINLAPNDSLLAALLKGGRFTMPASPRVVYRFENVATGYQYSPTEPSPARLEAKLPDTPSLTVGDTQLWEVRDDNSRLLYTTVKGTIRGEPEALACSPQLSPSRFGGQPELLVECDVSNNPFGAGPCGACPARTFAVFGVGKDGMAQVRAAVFFTSAPCGGGMQRAAAPDLSWISFRADTCKEEGAKYTGITLKRDPTTGMYKQDEGFANNLKWTDIGY